MTSQKRSASQAQLSNRPAKIPRTRMTRSETEPGVNSSPSQSQGLLEKWLSLAKETVAYIFSLSEEAILPMHNQNSNSSQLPLWPSQVPAITESAPSPRLQRRPPMREHSYTPTNLFASSSTSVFRPPPLSHLPSSTTTATFSRLSTFASVTAQTSTANSPTTSNFRSDIPSLDAVQRAISRSRYSEGPVNGVRKNYKEREHIYARQHKKRVKEELTRKLYALQVTKGYQSDYDTFRGYLQYRQRLEELQKNEPSSHVRDKSRTPNEQIIAPSDQLFFERAVEKAKKSLQSPRPPRPFSPTIEQLRLSQRSRDEAIYSRLHPKRQPLPDRLPSDAQAEVDALVRKRGVISKSGKEQVSDRDLSRLMPCQWLNDEIINFYGQLIMDRSTDAEAAKENKTGKKRILDAHYFSTFFWSKLKSGYEKGRLAKWTKKIDIFAKDIVLIPVNHNNSHWTAAAVDFRKKRIESYDSMDLDRSNVYAILRNYLDDEHKNKKKKPFDFTGWEDYRMETFPQQENGYDCGVFTCQTLESLSRGEDDFNFSQKDMPYLRQRMIWEIGRAKLANVP